MGKKEVCAQSGKKVPCGHGCVGEKLQDLHFFNPQSDGE